MLFVKGNLTIASGAAESDAVRAHGFTFFYVHMPAAWTAASLGFEVSHDGVTYAPLYDADGNLVEITPAVDKAYVLPAEVAAAHYLKLWSQTSGSGVNQAAAREIELVMKA